MPAYQPHTTLFWTENQLDTTEMDLIAEEPLSIRIQGKPYSVVMRTPGDELAQVAGFCLGEGIIDLPSDIQTLSFCDGEDSNVVTLTLNPNKRVSIAKVLNRRGYISQTSCGICGKEIVDDMSQEIKAVDQSVKFPVQMILEGLASLSQFQNLRIKTRASHAAAIYNADSKMISIGEDVGRHNALDKAIGKLLLNKNLLDAKLLFLSSRISYELVQKSGRAGIPIIIAISRPTTLAVNLADKLNITLACLARNDGLMVFTHKSRIDFKSG